MILVFDLDDTLYPEKTFVDSGFKAVANFLSLNFELNADQIFIEMTRILSGNGRGLIFDQLLKNNNIFSKSLVKRCISIYRYHNSDITLYADASYFLKNYENDSIYLVTDGNKLVQDKKIKALGLQKYFKKIFITHRYGLRNAKPSTYCFDMIRKIENTNWENIAYIGDNPNKDFISLNPLGVCTIRVMRGEYAQTNLGCSYDAKFRISSFDEITAILRK